MIAHSLDHQDLDGRDLVWLAILCCAQRGPVPLAQVLIRVERDAGQWTAAASVSRYLHEMARGRHILLTCDGARWMVALGPKGRQTLDRLLGRAPSPHVPAIRKAYLRLCRLFGIGRSAYAV